MLSVHRICRQWATFRGLWLPNVAIRAHYLCEILESPAILMAGLRAMTVHVANGILNAAPPPENEPSDRRTLMVKPRVPTVPQLELLLGALARVRSSELGIASPAEEGQPVGGLMVYRMGGALTSLPLIIRLFQQAESPPGVNAKRSAIPRIRR